MRAFVAVLVALALGGCVAGPPAGPSVVALPSQGKDLQVFAQDDVACRQYASAQIGYGSPAEAANQSQVNSAVLGTVAGAAAGAAIGAAAGNPALGAAIGAGSGLVLGTGAGANAAGYSADTVQRAYDVNYMQCMASKGNSVPQVAAAGPPSYPAYGYPAYAAYPAPYYYPYAYPYPYPYPYYGSVFVGYGWGGHRHWR
jgi:OmpA family protein